MLRTGARGGYRGMSPRREKKGCPCSCDSWGVTKQLSTDLLQGRDGHHGARGSALPSWRDRL